MKHQNYQQTSSAQNYQFAFTVFTPTYNRAHKYFRFAPLLFLRSAWILGLLNGLCKSENNLTSFQKGIFTSLKVGKLRIQTEQGEPTTKSKRFGS